MPKQCLAALPLSHNRLTHRAALQVCEHDDSACVAAHLAAKRWASAIKAALGWE